MHQLRPDRPAARGVRLVLGTFLAASAWAGTALADSLPMPSVDFSLKAKIKRNRTLDLAYSQSKMRVEMKGPKASAPIIGIIDFEAHKMLMMMPNVANMALEIEIPPEYAVGALSGEGVRVGESQVAGEPCDLWKVDAETRKEVGKKIGPTTACITADGIALRTEAEIDGHTRVLYEATEVTRGPQDPALFQLPPGVQVMNISKSKLGGALNLPGLGGLLNMPR